MDPCVFTLPDGFTIGGDRPRLDMNVVHCALAEACWAPGRRRDLTERAFAHGPAFGGWAPDGTTVGFGRLVTDRTFRAHLADIVILPAARGRELGKALVAAVLDHPDLVTAAKWTLATADAHAPCAGFGLRTSPLCANDRETNATRKFTVEGVRIRSCRCPR